MAFATCPFCTSGIPWNRCDCKWAVIAARSNFSDTRKAFVKSGGRVEVRTAPAAVEFSPRLAEAVGIIAPEGKNETRQRKAGQPKAKPKRAKAGKTVRGRPKQVPRREPATDAAADHISSVVAAGTIDGQHSKAATFDKKAWMKAYMRDHRRGLRRRAAQKEAKP
jgi:hypothetical protein